MAGENTGDVVYETIQYEDIGYEMLNRLYSPDEGAVGYEVLRPIAVCKRTPSDLKEPNEEFGEEMILSSQCITTLTDPRKKSVDYFEIIYESE